MVLESRIYSWNNKNTMFLAICHVEFHLLRNANPLIKHNWLNTDRQVYEHQVLCRQRCQVVYVLVCRQHQIHLDRSLPNLSVHCVIFSPFFPDSRQLASCLSNSSLNRSNYNDCMKPKQQQVWYVVTWVWDCIIVTHQHSYSEWTTPCQMCYKPGMYCWPTFLDLLFHELYFHEQKHFLVVVHWT